MRKGIITWFYEVFIFKKAERTIYSEHVLNKPVDRMKSIIWEWNGLLMCWEKVKDPMHRYF